MNQVLNVVSVDNYEQIINNVSYAAFNCSHPSSDKNFKVLVTENLLRRKGIDSSCYDYMSDTKLILKDSVDLKTGEITSPETQIQRIVDEEQVVRNGVPAFRADGTPIRYELIFLNSVTGDIVKGDLLKAENRRSADGTKAELAMKKEENRALDAARKRSERILLGLKPVAETEAPKAETEAPKAEKATPVVEMNAPVVETIATPVENAEAPF